MYENVIAGATRFRLELESQSELFDLLINLDPKVAGKAESDDVDAMMEAVNSLYKVLSCSKKVDENDMAYSWGLMVSALFFLHQRPQRFSDDIKGWLILSWKSEHGFFSSNKFKKAMTTYAMNMSEYVDAVVQNIDGGSADRFNTDPVSEYTRIMSKVALSHFASRGFAITYDDIYPILNRYKSSRILIDVYLSGTR